MGEQDFVRYEFKMSFRRISCIVQGPRLLFVSTQVVCVILVEYVAVCGWWLMSLDQNNRIKLEIMLIAHSGQDIWVAVPDNIFSCISLNKKVYILIMISLKFVLEGSIDDEPALIQMMAWC